MKAIFQCSVIACVALLVTSSAMADSFTINDQNGKNSDSTGVDATGWNNWNNAPGNMNNKDEHGTPEVESMTINYANNFITSIVVSLESNTTRQYFDSLFINTNYTDGSQWDGWDYYAIDGVEQNNNEQYIAGGQVAQTSGFYSVANNYAYLYAQNGGSRNAHEGNSTTNKSGIDSDDLAASSHDFAITFEDNNITYTFGNGLALHGGFFVAYAPWCANDVVGGGIPMDPVPEPATMLLFGTGIAGLAGLGRKKMSK